MPNLGLQPYAHTLPPPTATRRLALLTCSPRARRLPSPLCRHRVRGAADPHALPAASPRHAPRARPKPPDSPCRRLAALVFSSALPVHAGCLHRRRRVVIAYEVRRRPTHSPSSIPAARTPCAPQAPDSPTSMGRSAARSWHGSGTAGGCSMAAPSPGAQCQFRLRIQHHRVRSCEEV